MWWESSSPLGFVNNETVETLVPVASSGTWKINGETIHGDTVQLKGTYASQVEAQQAIRELCQGIDPITVTEGT